MLHLLCAAALALTAPPTTRPVTLAEAVALALAHNPGFASQREAVEAARGRWQQARAALLPNVVGSASATRQSIPPVTGPTLPGFTFFSANARDLRFAVNQSIFDRRARENTRAQALRINAAAGDVEKARIDLVQTVRAAFYDLLLSRVQIATAQATLDQVTRQLAQASLRVHAGTAAHLDELRSDVQVSQARSDLIRQTTNGDIARQVLANLLGMPPETPLWADGNFEEVRSFPARAALMADAMARRPDLRAASERLRAARAATRSARAGHLPTVGASVAHDESFGQRFPLDQTLDIDSATVSVNLPVFDGGNTEGQVREARANERKAGFDLEALRQQVELDVSRALALIAEARAVIDATGTAVAQAIEALTDTEAGYQQGIRTYLEVLDAQLALAVARNNRAQAERDYSVATGQLEQAVGRGGER